MRCKQPRLNPFFILPSDVFRSLSSVYNPYYPHVQDRRPALRLASAQSSRFHRLGRPVHRFHRSALALSCLELVARTAPHGTGLEILGLSPWRFWPSLWKWPSRANGMSGPIVIAGEAFDEPFSRSFISFVARGPVLLAELASRFQRCRSKDIRSSLPGGVPL